MAVSFAANIVTISGSPTIPGPYNYVITLTGGCGIVTASGSIFVTPDNTVSLTSVSGSDNQSVCVNSAIIPVTYTTTGATNASFAGLPAGVTGSWAANTVTISGTPTSAGTHNFTVTLSGGCGTVTATGIIIVNPDNTITLTSGAPTTNQALCVNTPVTDITYSTTGATGVSFTGLPAGVTGTWAANTVTINGTPTATGINNYTITLTGGCGTITESGTITVTADNTITFTSAAGTDNQTVCINSAITAITYSTTGATGVTITGLPAGVTGSLAADVVTISGTPTVSGPNNYTISLTGGCGTITATGSITVNVSSPVDVLVAADANPLCAGTTVNLTATPSNGGTTPAYQWQVNGLNTGVNSNTYSYVPVNNDVVTVILTSNAACATGNPATSLPVTLTVNNVPSGSVTVTNVACFNGTTGGVDLTVTGGTAPYTFLWSNGVTTEDLANVAAGSYSVTVTDANSCTATASGNVTAPASALSSSITSQTDVSVNGGSDGSVSVAGSGGVPPYLYKLGSGAYQASGTFGTLSAGSYTITIQDAGFCTFDVPVTITQPALPLSGSITLQSNVLCFGGNTGSVTVSGANGIPPYEYSLDGGSYQASGTFGTLTIGTYTVTVRDNALNTIFVPVTITQPAAALTVSATETDALCSGASSGTATATAAGGTAPYTYLWNTSTVQTVAIATGLAAGSYTVTVTDANGCSASANVTVNQPPALTVALTQVNVLCNGGSNGSSTATATGGTGPYTYSWNTSPAQTTTTATGLSAGSYTVTVTDSQGCTVTGSAQITQPAILALDAVPTEARCPDSNDGSIALSISGGTSPYSVIWNDGITTQNRTGLLPGTYSVVVTDMNSCAQPLSTEVGYIGAFDCLIIPDIITPNNDGYNDEWRIRNIDIYPDAEVRVYNRWGKMIFKTKNISGNPWNGRYKGKLVPTDSYHYILYLNDGSEPRSGVISVIR
jgi:gliding motility-associated-like protein